MRFQFNWNPYSFLLVCVVFPLLASSFATSRRSELTSVSSRQRTLVFLVPPEGYSGTDHGDVGSEENEQEIDDDNDEYDDEDDNDEITVKPYRNRSLAWTLRYRKLNPYEQARARVISFGHRSKADWDEAVSSGQLGQYVPSYPDEMYAPEWDGWEEWLGLMRSYNDTKNIATNVLRLKSLDDYLLFVKSNSKRAEGLRIPVRPDLYYDEWIDEETFFGKIECE